MGKAEIPFLDFSGEAITEEIGSEKWKEMCEKVREASENYGCFLVKYDKISSKLREDMLMSMKKLFDLPEEIKTKYINPKPYRSYSGKCPILPFYESFGLDDAPNLHSVQAFTNLMWPVHGNPTFCESLHEMSSKMLELNYLVLRMILESFGMESHYDLHVQDSTSLFRLMKYIAPPNGGCGGSDNHGHDDSAIALRAHTDKNAITILCQNEIQGLEIQPKDGDWTTVVVPKDALVVIIGEALKVWSNGRLEAARHRVAVSGERDRYSCGLFSMPKEEAKIEVAPQLVDKDHPLLYRPFIFSDYISYFASKLSDDALDIYARI